jgi:S-formylglutathione hydrolase FrmB
MNIVQFCIFFLALAIGHLNSPMPTRLPTMRGIVIYMSVSAGMAEGEIVKKWGRPNAVYGRGPGCHDWYYFSEHISIHFDNDGKVVSRKLDIFD